jgi:hypothetical protein
MQGQYRDDMTMAIAKVIVSSDVDDHSTTIRIGMIDRNVYSFNRSVPWIAKQDTDAGLFSSYADTISLWMDFPLLSSQSQDQVYEFKVCNRVGRIELRTSIIVRMQMVGFKSTLALSLCLTSSLSNRDVSIYCCAVLAELLEL